MRFVASCAIWFFSTVMAVVPVGRAFADSPSEAPGRALLFEGMGSLHRPITTRSALAQRYFDQGLTLSYAFNHVEAERSFVEATRLDPSCAMCFWGAALVLGSHINAPITKIDEARALAHLERARALAASGTPIERALVGALSTRYSADPYADRASLDRAYAAAMRSLAALYPNDVDVLALAAEALMDVSPWNYWSHDGRPLPHTPEILKLLERAMALDPQHPGANHFYIHAVEASPTPELGIAAADRLQNLVPAAGHLVHMPSHIYIRVGRYRDAALVNERAIVADERYAELTTPGPLYGGMYRLHNPHFLWTARALLGQKARALSAAELVSSMAAERMHGAHGHSSEMLENYLMTPLLARVRFGLWDEILKTPEPAAEQVYSRALWSYASAIAHARRGQEAEARAHLAELERLAATPRFREVTLSGVNPVGDVLAVAVEVTRGEVAAARGALALAIHHLEAAVRLEDALRYMEPSDWHHPTRQILGAMLLRAGRARDAERVYREDLAKLPENGWSLFGLARALEAQGRAKEAAEAKARFACAFRDADVTLEASSF